MVCLMQMVKLKSNFGCFLNLESSDKVSSICQVPSQLAEDDALKGSERDKNEMPLGKIIKDIKSQGTKGKKVKRKKAVPAETKKAENDIDILNMVREINIDNLGLSTNYESSNGHENSLSKKLQNDPECATIKKRKAEVTLVPVPKRKRSSFAHGKSRSSSTPPKAPPRVSGEDSSGVKLPSGAKFNPDTHSSAMQRKKVKDNEASIKAKVKASKSNHDDDSDKSEEHDMKVKSYCQAVLHYCRILKLNLSML